MYEYRRTVVFCVCTGANATLNGNSTIPPLTLDPTMPTESTVNCPSVYTYRVYQTINTSIDQIAIEHMLFSSVDVYVWSPKFKSVKYEPYTSEAFKRQYLNTRFKYIGDATAGKLYWCTAMSKLKYFVYRISAANNWLV